VIEVKLASESVSKVINELVDSYDKKEFIAPNILLDKEIVRKTIHNLVQSKGVYLGVKGSEVFGLIAGIYVPNILSKDKMFHCLFIYLKKGYRTLTKKFLRMVEDKLRQRKYTVITLSHLEDHDGEKMDRYYKMLGYRKIESHYLRGL